MSHDQTFGNWGRVQEPGLDAFEEFVRIFREEIPREKFYWNTFFDFRDANKKDKSIDYNLIDPARALCASIQGDDNWCGSKACVAGWAITTHPHLLTWVDGLGLTRTKDAIRSCSDYNQLCSRGFSPPIESFAFASVFGITPSEAEVIIYGHSTEPSEVDSKKWWNMNDKDRALYFLESALKQHGR